MGTPLPPNPPDDGCAICFGVGRAFGDLPTPKYITVEVVGLQPDDAWDQDDELTLLAPQDLMQTDDPCIYELTVGGLHWYWRWGTSISLFSCEGVLGGKVYFRGDVSDTCVVSIPNENITGTGKAAIGGVANMSFVTEYP